MVWYWWLSIFIYSMGISFTAGITVGQSDFEDSLFSIIFLILLWPIALFAGLYFNYLADFFENKFRKIKNWWAERKEDKLFYENHLDNKFERSGIKFDENDDVWRN